MKPNMIHQQRYRFYLGVSQERFLSDLPQVAGLPSSFTSFSGVGMWLGQREDSTVIELVTYDADFTLARAQAVAEELAYVYEQEAVLVTVETVEVTLVKSLD